MMTILMTVIESAEWLPPGENRARYRVELKSAADERYGEIKVTMNLTDKAKRFEHGDSVYMELSLR